MHLYYFHDSSAAFLQQVKDILGVKLVNVIVVYAILCLIHADLIKNVLQYNAMNYSIENLMPVIIHNNSKVKLYSVTS